MRDWAVETKNRTVYIRKILASAGAKGVVFANSGGKDCALAGILCKMACDNTLSVMLPCGTTVNYGSDLTDARALCDKFGIENILVDLTAVKSAFMSEIAVSGELSDNAVANIAARLRMVTTNALATSRNCLVAGTGNLCEYYVGYFTKWGDGAYDFNPIADLLVSEVYDFLRYLGAPDNITKKPPSGGLYEGQTDEGEIGVTYAQIEAAIRGEAIPDGAREIIARWRSRTEHKRRLPPRYPEM